MPFTRRHRCTGGRTQPLSLVGVIHLPVIILIGSFPTLNKAIQSHDDMHDQKDNDVPAAPPTAGCTPLERRLTFCCCFLSTLVLNALLRVFLWPYVSGSPYLIFVVTGTRIVVGVSLVKLHRYLTGEERVDFLAQTAVEILPIILVDLGLGSCYRDCSVRHLVSQGYCKHGGELSRVCRI